MSAEIDVDDVTAEVEPESKPENTNTGTAEPEVWISSSVDPAAAAEGMDQVELNAWLTVYSLWIVLTIAFNIAVVYAILKSRASRKKPTDKLLLALVISRIMIGLFVIPTRITGLYSERYLGSILCKLCHYTFAVSTVSSVLVTLSIAVAKYRASVGLWQDSFRRINLNIFLVFLVASIYSLRAVFVYDLNFIELPAETTWSCSVIPDRRYVDNIISFVDFFLLFCAPLLIILICYRQVLRQEFDKKTTVHKVNKVAAQFLKKNLSYEELKSIRDASLNSIRMIIVISVLFTICSSVPYMWKLYMRCVSDLPRNFSIIDHTIHLVSYSNPWLNALVILYFRPDLRGEIFQCHKKVRPSDEQPQENSRPIKTKVEVSNSESNQGTGQKRVDVSDNWKLLAEKRRIEKTERY